MLFQPRNHHLHENIGQLLSTLGVFDHYHHLNMPSFIGENHFNLHLFHLGSHRCPKRAKSGLEIRGSSAKTDKYPNGIQSILSRGTKSCQDLIQYTFNPQPPDYCPCPPNWNWCRCLSSLVDCALQLNFTQDIGHLQSTFGVVNPQRPLPPPCANKTHIWSVPEKS